MDHLNYCPTCFELSLSLSSKGVIFVYINGLKLQNGHFLFNLEKQTRQELSKTILLKTEECLKWHAKLKNPRPIKDISIVSDDFICENNSSHLIGKKISVMEYFFEPDNYYRSIKLLCEKLSLPFSLEIS